MWRIYLAIALVWLALSPPLFTQGACTDEFNEVGERLTKAGDQLRSADVAASYFRSSGTPISVITPERCRESKPRFMARCGSSTVVFAKMPIRNLVCRIYRDDAVGVYLEYDDMGRILRFHTDMAPFKSLAVPFTKSFIHWGR